MKRRIDSDSVGSALQSLALASFRLKDGDRVARFVDFYALDQVSVCSDKFG